MIVWYLWIIFLFFFFWLDLRFVVVFIRVFDVLFGCLIVRLIRLIFWIVWEKEKKNVGYEGGCKFLNFFMLRWMI